jgi:hypothetical protein
LLCFRSSICSRAVRLILTIMLIGAVYTCGGLLQEPVGRFYS